MSKQSKLLVCLVVLVVVLVTVNNVSSIPLFGNLKANLRTLDQQEQMPPNVQEAILANFLDHYAELYPMQYANDDHLTADGRSLTIRRNSLGLGRSGFRESTRYPWNRREYVARKDIERFPFSQEERESRMPENMFPSEIEAL